jgi:hypothetical protein
MKIISAFKRTKFVSDRMPYIILRGCWCDIIVPDVHAPTENKIYTVQGDNYEELEHLLGEFPNYHTAILLRDFNDKVGRVDIFKPTIESLHKLVIITELG